MPNWKGGLSGAASGAAIGSMVPVIGTGVGAALGGALGFFGGGDGSDKKSDAEKSAQRRRKALMNMLDANNSQLQNQSPTDSAFFRTGMGQISAQTQERREADEAQAARTGASGEMGIAMAAQRQEAAGRGMRSLLGDAERHLQDRQARALSRLLQAQGISKTAAERRRRTRLRRQKQSNDAIASAVGAAAPLLGAAFGKKPGDQSGFGSGSWGPGAGGEKGWVPENDPTDTGRTAF